MLKTLLKFLSTPIHVHVPLPFSQSVFLRLDTFYDGPTIDGCTGQTSYRNFSLQPIGAILNVKDFRYGNLTVGIGLLSLELGTYERYR